MISRRITAPPAVVAALASLSLVFAAAAAAAEDGRAVMQNVYDQSRLHDNQSADVQLTIRDAEGESRVRNFSFLYKIFDDRSKSLVKFYKPASVRGTGLLSDSADGAAETRQWLYLPSLRSMRRLSTGERNAGFMGSDFTNADIAGRKVEQDKHTLVKRGEKKIVVRSVPRDSKDPYSRIESTILTAVNVPESIVFYDRKGDKLKTLFNRRIRKVKGMYTVSLAEMVNHQSGGASTLEKNRVDVDSVIDANDVGFKGLQN